MRKNYTKSWALITFKPGVKLNKKQLLELADLLANQETTDKFSKGQIINLIGDNGDYTFRIKNEDGDIVLWGVK